MQVLGPCKRQAIHHALLSDLQGLRIGQEYNSSDKCCVGTQVASLQAVYHLKLD